jgi:GNAT superfamily N-acetyltransferase
VSDFLRGAPDAMRQAVGVPAAWLAMALANLGVPETPVNRAVGPGVAVGGLFYPVRTLAAEDAPALRDFLQHGLSEESRRLRFMAPMPEVPESAAAWLADRDGHDRVALAALDPYEHESIVGVVEYASQIGGPPEVAVAVADAYQGKGLGKNLLVMLATLSLASGQGDWACDVLADNDGPLRLLSTVGEVHLGEVSKGVRAVTVELEPQRLFGVQVGND